MLLPDNIHPENSIYYNGAFVIESLKKDTSYKMLDLYQEVKLKKQMTFSVFILCLDWLYLLDVAKLNHKGEIELCS
ncbi:MAG: hypothetical protein QM535_11210 [Limnohabitans sp.]|nr:hypothetical protein [Limnohabitans sp.]